MAGNAEVYQHQLSALESKKKTMGKRRVWMGGLVSAWVGGWVSGWAGERVSEWVSE